MNKVHYTSRRGFAQIVQKMLDYTAFALDDAAGITIDKLVADKDFDITIEELERWQRDDTATHKLLAREAIQLVRETRQHSYIRRLPG